MILTDLKTTKKGSVTVEFAMITFTFLILVIGSMEIGWALYIQNAMVDASRFGARMGATQGSTTSVIEDFAKDYMKNFIPSSDNVTVSVSVDPATAEEGTPIQVIVSAPYDDKIGILGKPLILKSIILRAQTTMNKEPS